MLGADGLPDVWQTAIDSERKKIMPRPPNRFSYTFDHRNTKKPSKVYDSKRQNREKIAVCHGLQRFQESIHILAGYSANKLSWQAGQTA